jgi:hypothetical protein
VPLVVTCESIIEREQEEGGKKIIAEEELLYSN